MRRPLSDRLSGVLLTLLGLGMSLQSLRYPMGNTAEPGPGYVPLILSISLTVFGIATVASGGSSPEFRWATFTEARKGMAITAGLVFAAFALEPLGYRLTISALLLFYLGVVERRSWIGTLVFGLGFGFGSYHLFARMMRVPLPIGMLGI